ncbi:hypothetical protein FKP32DRAFT_1613943 [Trametes sanguinea]|nr:hypothetical protein FKP32DRAFT_1613943 [Trametes sanguinea]
MPSKRKCSPPPSFEPLISGGGGATSKGSSRLPRRLGQAGIRSTRNFVVNTISQGRIGGRSTDITKEPPSEPSEVEPTADEGVDAATPLDNCDAGPHTDPLAEHEPSPEVENLSKRERKDQRAAERVRSWLPYRQEYLDELLRHYGRKGADVTRCSICEQEAEFRCPDCRVSHPLCQQCLLKEHNQLVFHRVERWNGRFYERISLCSLGLVIPLGHDGRACPDPSAPQDIVVYHVNGYHRLRVTTCTCTSSRTEAMPVWKQYLRAAWFPATTTRPSTAFTFAVLDLFHQLTLQSKINAYDFFLTLGRLTDNSGLSNHPSRYKQFCHIVRLWRHLQQLKWAGRGQDPDGAAATAEGSLAVQCAACPHPGKNLPDGWDLSPPEVLWIYTLYLMMDANFRCRCKDRGLEDQELAPGWSYCVHQQKFQEHIARTAGRGNQDNTCSAEHNAILKANLRKDGYVASGIGAVLCARHAMYRPNGVGDLHLGEKFSYMDFLLVSTLLSVMVFLLVVSYDIACQYCKHFNRRVQEDFPEELRPDLDDLNIRWVIPKHHIAVHGANHSHFSLNNLSGVGRVYGEGVESSWSSLNPIAMSTREMALATRHEVLNDHMGDWNWRKTIGFEDFLRKSLLHASKMAIKQRAAFDEFNATFPADVTREWERLVEIWNVNPTAVPDPFAEPEAKIKFNAVRLQFAQEEMHDLTSGATVPPLLDLSPSTFIQLGLELEEQQYVVALRGKSDGDVADLLERRNTLRRRIIHWAEAQNVYMPAVSQLRVQTDTVILPTTATDNELSPAADDAATTGSTWLPEDVSLWLPSSLPHALRQGDLTTRLTNMEQRLHLAQIEDSLADIRRLRRILQGVAQFKRLNVSGTGNKPNTRIRSLYTKFQRKQTRSANRYRAAYRALCSLDPEGDWRRTFRELLDKDLTGPGQDDPGHGEGYREVSWIWLVPSGLRLNSDEAAEYNDSMRAEWACSKARAERWEEEVILLAEEMRRVVAYWEWQAGWWEEQADRRAHALQGQHLPSDLGDGVRAFALRHVQMFNQLAARCRERWTPALLSVGRTPAWPLKPPPQSPMAPTQESFSDLEPQSDEEMGW